MMLGRLPPALEYFLFFFIPKSKRFSFQTSKKIMPKEANEQRNVQEQELVFNLYVNMIFPVFFLVS